MGWIVNILIFGQTEDPHVAEVTAILMEKRQKYTLIDRFSPDLVSLAIENGSEKIKFNASYFEHNAETAVWFRLKPKFSDGASKYFANHERRLFFESSWVGLFRALARMIPNARLINNPAAVIDYSGKPNQLLKAHEAGLNTPRTCISNDSDEITDFFGDTKIIYKPLTGQSLDIQKKLPATIVKRSKIASSKDSIASVPSIFQEYIEKAYELRVSVFGKTVIGTKIDSQNNEKARVDYRDGIYDNDMYSAIEIGAELKRKLLKYLELCGLESGMFDLVVKPDGTTVFIECNPDGQWLWLEMATGQRMCEAMADLIIGNSSNIPIGQKYEIA